MVPDCTAPVSDVAAAFEAANIQDQGGEDMIELLLASVGDKLSLQDALSSNEACDWDEYLKYDTLEESMTNDVCAPFILRIIILMSPA